MSPPSDRARPSPGPPEEEPQFSFSDEDFNFGASEAVQQAARRDREFHPVALAARGYFDAADRAVRAEERAKPPPPRAPFLIGVFEFPWYLSTLQCWIPMCLLLLGTGVLMVFSATLRASFLMAVFTFGYISACCLRIVEATAAGADEIEEWPAALAWKEWMWSFFQLLNYLVQAALVAFVLTWWSWFLYGLPALLVVFIVYPLITLAAMEADSWLPLSPAIFRTLQTHLWAWAIFYAESALVFVVWCVLAVAGAVLAGWWSVPVTTGLLAAVAIIYARLLGRLAWCLNQ